MSPEYVAGLCAIFTAFGALLSTLLTKWTDSRVRILKAAAEAKKDENLVELEMEKECTEELHARLAMLEESHKECIRQHQECEMNLARLQGYMDGKFEELEKKVTAIEQSPSSVVQVIDQKIEG